jgi:hypothetical protein
MRLNMPYDFATIKAELDKEEWPVANLRNWPDGKRAKLIRPKSKILLEIFEFINSDEARMSVVESFDKYVPQVEERWRWDKDKVFRNTTLHAEFTRDLPGMFQGVHMDTKFLIGTGMIYLTPHDDPQWATKFHASDQADSDYIVSPSDYCNGWMHMNDWNSWHSGGNMTDQVRYTILVPLTLATTIEL